MMMASLALSAYQRRIAEQFGIEPGAEMKAAMAVAKRKGLPVQLIDREIGITLRPRQSTSGLVETLGHDQRPGVLTGFLVRKLPKRMSSVSRKVIC